MNLEAMKSDRLAYRDEIPGFAPSSIIQWNAHRINEKEEVDDCVV